MAVMVEPLLMAKYQLPPLRPHAAPRPRISARFQHALSVPLTLVSAPAGFGKTTATLAAALELRVTAGAALAWLAIDAHDDEPDRFWRYVLAALRTADPALNAALEPLAATPQPDGPAHLAQIVNTLTRYEAPLLIVLDDYHLISQQELHDGLTLFIEHAPAHLHLVIVTRMDPPLPLHRLRARGQLLEIRAADLRFTPPEAAALLSTTLGVNLGPEALAHLTEQTEGWAAGLQLAGLALHGRAPATHAALLADLARSQRSIVDYLTEEVLAQQPAETRRFLMQTAILDRLCAPLCDAVTERTDSAALLDEIQRRNLFITALDPSEPTTAGERWYRYHALFADLLQGHLAQHNPHEAPELHRRASRWYAATGNSEAAIEHALAGQAYTEAAQLIDQRAGALALAGRARTIERWLRRLPAGWQTGLPRANMAIGWALLLRGRHQEAQPYVHHAASAIDPDDEALRGEYHALCAGLAAATGLAAEALDHARQAITHARPEQRFVQAVATVALAGAHRELGDLDAAIATYEQAIPLCQAARLSVAEMLSRAHLGALCIIQGRLQRAAAATRPALAAAPHDPTASAARAAYSEVLIEWNDLAAADRELALALPLARQGGHTAVLARGLILLARLRRAQGACAQAQAALDEALSLAPQTPVWLQPFLLAERARLWLDQGAIGPAEHLLAPPDGPLPPAGGHVREILPLALAQIRLAQGRAGDALALLTDVCASAEAGGRVGRLIEALVLRARAHDQIGAADEAAVDLCRALDLAAPEGYVHVFIEGSKRLITLLMQIDHPAAATILAAFPAAVREAAVARHGLAEPLTEREQAVLERMARGLTYQQIADDLFVSVNTVRHHVKGLYGKLQAGSRTAALARARELKLLP
jgi:LuxR family transcriptional regulator, maltose regulon positive regulatory protein